MLSTRPRRLAGAIAALAVLAATFAWVNLAGATSITPLQVVALPGATLSGATDVNDAGIITGWSDGTGHPIHGLTYNPSTGIYRDLQAPPGQFSSGSAINNHGVVAGVVEDTAAIWDPATGNWKELGYLGTGTTSEANDINDSGFVVGNSENTAGDLAPFVWDPNTQQMTEIASFGGPTGEANAISAAGLVVGGSDDASGNSHAWVHDLSTGETKDIGNLGGDDAEANGINNQGIIVGWSATESSPRPSAFRYDMATGQMENIGSLTPAQDQVVAFSVADAGYIVGVSSRAIPPEEEGFVWDPTTGEMTGIGQLAPSDTSSADAIGNQGIVVGQVGARWGVWAQVTGLPGAPDSFAASGCGGTVDLTWAEGFDGYTDISGYTLSRDDQQLAQLGADTLSYSDDDVSVGTTYEYELTATNSEGTGPAASVSVTPAACPTTTTATTAVPPPPPQPIAPTFTG